MSLVDRARNIITNPAAEWPVIAAEPASVGSLYTGYIIPLALIAPICSFISGAFFLHHLVLGAVAAVVSFVLELVYVFVAALIAQALAPNFGGANDRMAALKWIAYSYTPRWLSGIFLLIPIFGSFVVLLASLYSLYLLYVGTTPVMRVPQERAVGYVVIVIVTLIVLGILIGFILGIIGAAALFSSGAFTQPAN
jgi:hypothetical protein